jgi:hypothetical protein
MFLNGGGLSVGFAPGSVAGFAAEDCGNA